VANSILLSNLLKVFGLRSSVFGRREIVWCLGLQENGLQSNINIAALLRLSQKNAVYWRLSGVSGPRTAGSCLKSGWRQAAVNRLFGEKNIINSALPYLKLIQHNLKLKCFTSKLIQRKSNIISNIYVVNKLFDERINYV
jgi:hypothetical protein